MKHLIGTAHCLAYSTIMALTWLKRKQFQLLCYKYLALIENYLSESNLLEHQETVRSARNILMKKFLFSVCKMIVLYVNIYNHVSNSDCVDMEGFTYKAIAIYYGIANIQQLIVDINVVFGLVFIDMCLNMLRNNLQNIERDIRLMYKAQLQRQTSEYADSQQRIHHKWRCHLSRSVEEISKEVLKLQDLAKDHMEIYQFPVLFLLLALFVGLVNLMFNVTVYVADFKNVKIFKLLFYIYILVASFSNVMIFYNICDSLRRGYRKMRLQVYRIGVYASLANAGLLHRDNLLLNLDIFLLQLRLREFKITVCGLFEIRNSAGVSMIYKIFLNLIYLIQSVLQSL